MERYRGGEIEKANKIHRLTGCSQSDMAELETNWPQRNTENDSCSKNIFSQVRVLIPEKQLALAANDAKFTYHEMHVLQAASMYCCICCIVHDIRLALRNAFLSVPRTPDPNPNLSRAPGHSGERSVPERCSLAGAGEPTGDAKARRFFGLWFQRARC